MQKSPSRGRPGLSYEEVADAANRLGVQGKRPSLRSIRELLGGGSLEVIRRHLATWRSSRKVAQARSPFAISPQDVASLEPFDFAGLINHLVRLETQKNNLATTPDTTLRVNDADGGVDGIVEWAGGLKHTARFPARKVGWQAKSGHRLGPSELVREIQRRDGSDLKPGVKALLAAGGAYVLFSAADMTATQKAAGIRALRDVARDHIPNCDPIIKIIAGEEIAAWATEDLWTRTFLIKAAGRENPALLSTFEEWEQHPRLRNHYVWNDLALKTSEAIRIQLENRGTTYRLDGAPGLGKTRLVLEAVRPVANAGFGVVYFNARYPGTELDLLRAFPTWRRSKTTGTIVVDDCSLVLHQEIAQAVAGTEMSVVTIDYRRDSGANVTLRPVADDAIEQIVRAHTAFPPGGRANADVARIIKYAQGWPLMAILILEAIINRKAHIADLDDDQLTARLIENPNDPDSSAVLRVLALFDHVGYRDDVVNEWELLRELFLPEMSRSRFYKIVKFYERKGLIVSIGRYWRVTPPPLAIRLTREWLDDAPPESQEALFQQLPPPLLESFARRFNDISTSTAEELADRLLSPQGQFGSLKGILGSPRVQVLNALAEVNPSSAIATLRRVILPLSDESLREINEVQGRQILVFALECIAFHRKHFSDGARVLVALARNENATNSNNATGTLIKLFGLVGSQTEAPPEDRLQILAEISSRDDAPSRDLLVGILRRILSRDTSYVRLGPESQGGRAPLTEWKPTTLTDIFSYCALAIDLALSLSQRDEDGRTRAKSIIADAIPILARYGMWEDLDRAVRALSNGAWPKAVEAMMWTLQHGLKEADTSERARVEDLLRILSPADIEERIKLFVSDPPHNLEQRNGEIVNVALEKVEEFAAETIESGSIRQVLDTVSTGLSHRLPHGYGQAVAKMSTDLEGLAQDALAAFAEAREPRNDLALMSVVGTIGERRPELRQAILGQVALDERLLPALPALTVWPAPSTADAERLVTAYADNRLTSPPRHNILYGKAFANVGEPAVRALADLFTDRGWYASAIQLLTFGVENSETFDDGFAKIILASNFIVTPMEDIHEWSLLEVAKRLVKAGNDEFTIAIAKQMIDLSLSNAGFGARRRVADLWPGLIVRDDVWRKLRHRYGDLDRRRRLKLLLGLQYLPAGSVEHRSALEEVPVQQLLQFAAEFVDEVPWFLTENCEMFAREGGAVPEPLGESGLEPTPLMIELLQRFGDRDDVLRGLTSSLHSFMSVGHRAIYYERRARVVDEIPTFGSVKIAAWKEELRADLDHARRRAQAHDEEFDGGIF